MAFPLALLMLVVAASPNRKSVASMPHRTVAKRWHPPKPPPDGMVWIPGGEFSMGAQGAGDSDAQTLGDALPVHRVEVDAFWMDRTEVTNAEFARFVSETKYITLAERTPQPQDFPGTAPDALVAGSVVFFAPDKPVTLDDYSNWWRYVHAASWPHPFGPDSDIEGRDQDPVVHVAFEDAESYARWANKRLPTEAEFEFAARGGLSGKRYAWGDSLRPNGKWMANTFQGSFPRRDVAADGFAGIANVASFPPNHYGLYDITGNVWEWCSDWYRPDTYTQDAQRGTAHNPAGPLDSFDPDEPEVPKRVQRGGSFLCSDHYCTRYLVGARGKGDPSTSTSHVGFRCVRTP